MSALWVNGFRRIERAVAGPLEEWVQSETAIEAMIRLFALQGDVQRQLERALTAYLHLWHAPSLTDIRRLSQQMAYLERRVRELSREPDAQPVNGSGARPRVVSRG
jgi:uncharacterized membrane protein YccC